MPFFKNDDSVYSNSYSNNSNITNKQIQTMIQQLTNQIAQGNSSVAQPSKNKYVIILQPLEVLFRKEEELMGLFEIADKIMVRVSQPNVQYQKDILLVEFLQEFMPQFYEKYKLLIDGKP